MSNIAQIAARHLTIDGQSITIRPIKPADAAREIDFVRLLSPMTKYFRFLGGVKELSAADVKRFCDVDGDQSMAFIATVLRDGHETEIGVSRYAPGSAPDVREFAITIADAWQHKGLEALLIAPLVEAARTHGVKELYSIDFTENAAMHALADELRMTWTRHSDDASQTTYTLRI
jgi:GNAT superfamily N-acetyltransferase